MNTRVMSTRVLVIGSGGRELAILRKLRKSGTGPTLFCYGKHINPAIQKIVEKVKVGNLTASSFVDIKTFCTDYNIDLVVIGPEAPLGEGIVDYLIMAGINVIGPTRNLALIETSKIFLRNLMNACENTVKCKYFDIDYDSKDVLEWVRELGGDYVVKANGLCGGKGVKLSWEHINSDEELLVYLRDLRSTFLIEEKLYGDEFTLMAFSDGKTLKHMPIITDYKRRNDGNVGPNTGSMGCISYPGLPSFLTLNDYKVAKRINKDVVKRVQLEMGCKYKGIVYGSFIKTREGIKVIEYNARFGDPECISIMSVLESDLVEIFNAIVKEELRDLYIEYKPVFSTCSYIVPSYYPESSNKNISIDLELDDKGVVPASVVSNGFNFNLLGSRAVCYVEIGSTLTEIKEKLDQRLSVYMDNTDIHFRKDIPFRKDAPFRKGVPFRKEESTSVQKSCYESSGVNIEEGNMVVRKIKDLVESTYNQSTISNFGDFGGLYKFGDKILVSSTDGVGTKSALVSKYSEYGLYTLGHDLVNHCVNDILVKGAEPMFFLDYFAASKINSDSVREFVHGISDACRLSGTVLIGGETAEMPSVYHVDQFDIAGTIIGSVNSNELIEGKKNIRRGDVVMALPSSGPHTNGYSLIRRCVDDSTPKKILETLIEPHRCYLEEYKKIKAAEIKVRGMCHITGGGLVDNPPRMLPDDLSISFRELEIPEWVKYITATSGMGLSEARRVLNCGVGMIFVFSPDDSFKVKKLIPEMMIVGEVI